MARTRRSTGGVVSQVDDGSTAHDAGLRPGDRIIEVDGHTARDILDLIWAAQEGYLELLVERDGTSFSLNFELEPMRGLGFTFDEPLFDGIRRCPNRCIFCFVDQQPTGLRATLYVKDEDYRASFLHGSYVTMTNLTDEDKDRIVDLHLSPLYVSVHATHEPTRRRLLGRQKLPSIMPLLEEMIHEGICFWTQIVVVPPLNDRSILDQSLRDLATLHPSVHGVGIVPVGLTKHRQGLPSLSPIGEREARQILDQLDAFRSRASKTLGTSFAYAADELFLRAKRPLPKASYYDGYPLVENGIGLLRRFIDGLKRSVRSRVARAKTATQTAGKTAPIVIVTGTAAGAFFKDTVLPALAPLHPPRIEVLTVDNLSLGPTVTVAGLLTGRDILSAMDGHTKPTKILVCEYLIRQGSDVFLDDYSISQLEARLGCLIQVVSDSGPALVRAILSK